MEGGLGVDTASVVDTGDTSADTGLVSNWIGTDASSSLDLGNGLNGIKVAGSTNTIGEVGQGNSIAFNDFAVRLTDGAVRTDLSGNSIVISKHQFAPEPNTSRTPSPGARRDNSANARSP